MDWNLYQQAATPRKSLFLNLKNYQASSIAIITSNYIPVNVPGKI
jgi:hypothetical protein